MRKNGESVHAGGGELVFVLFIFVGLNSAHLLERELTCFHPLPEEEEDSNPSSNYDSSYHYHSHWNTDGQHCLQGNTWEQEEEEGKG